MYLPICSGMLERPLSATKPDHKDKENHQFISIWVKSKILPITDSSIRKP